MKINMMLSIDDFCSEPKHLQHMEKVVALINELGIRPTLFTIPLYENKYSILDLKYPRLDEILKHSEIACHGLTHINSDGKESDEMGGVSAEEFENKIGQSVDMLKERFGKKPTGYKAPGWIVESQHTPIIRKHFKWVQINEPGFTPLSHKKFFYFPITYDLHNIGSYITSYAFITSHLTNTRNDNVINEKNYLLFRKAIITLREQGHFVNFITMGELRDKLCQH